MIQCIEMDNYSKYVPQDILVVTNTTIDFQSPPPDNYILMNCVLISKLFLTFIKDYSLWTCSQYFFFYPSAHLYTETLFLNSSSSFTHSILASTVCCSLNISPRSNLISVTPSLTPDPAWVSKTVFTLWIISCVF